MAIRRQHHPGIIPAWEARMSSAMRMSRTTFLKSDLSGRTNAERTARKPFGEQHGGVVGQEHAKYGPALSGRGLLSGAQRLPYVAEEAEKHPIVDPAVQLGVPHRPVRTVTVADES
jgi:hypothetical protein